jgi:Acyl-CoA carboxylase epsilon subunit
MSENANRPVLRIVRGNPDDVELAALTAVVAAFASSGTAPTERPAKRSWWGDRARSTRQPLRPGEGAWRDSGLPR